MEAIMPKLIMCQGLPGSGKTTWAKSICDKDTHTIRVNKDDIREYLSQSEWTWSHENEKDVITIRDDKIGFALAQGYDVISDDTNFGRTHKVRLIEIAHNHGAEFSIKRFDTPIDECIERDKRREKPVGEKVIRNMANQYHVVQPATIVTPITQDKNLPWAVICDLDGTLADHKHRSPYDASTCDKDTLIKSTLSIISALWDTGRTIIYCSGREDKYREQTMTFLRDNYCPRGSLYMRPTGDYRKDWIIKKELFDNHIKDKYYVEFVLDDRDQVVKMWRALGLTCLQVAEGNF